MNRSSTQQHFLISGNVVFKKAEEAKGTVDQDETAVGNGAGEDAAERQSATSGTTQVLL